MPLRPQDRDRLVRLVQLHEGLRLKPYDDGRGNLTVGFGRNLTANGITREEAEAMLRRDLANAERSVLTRWPWMASLDPVRYAVVIDLCFNLGPAKLSTFKRTIAAIRAGDYAFAAGCLEDSLWFRQVKTRGHRDVAAMATGEWPPEVKG